MPQVKVANPKHNVKEIERLISQAEEEGVEIVVFPELSLTGYTCQDLFKQHLLLEMADMALLTLLEFTQKRGIIAIVGMPIVADNLLLNAAVVVQKGDILGVVAKEYLPNYCEFYEKRWFASRQEMKPTEIVLAGSRVELSPERTLFRTQDGVLFGVEICEDVWAPTPPSNSLAMAGAEIIFNLSASDELIGKHQYLKSLLSQQSARTMTGYVYSGSGFGESTQDVVYGGNALIYENGVLVKEGERFSLEPQLAVSEIDVEKLRSERRTNSTYVNAQRRFEAKVQNAHSFESEKPFRLTRKVNPYPFIPQEKDMQRSCKEILNIQSLGLAKRLQHTHCTTAVIGISGGLDSTLALLVAVRAFDMLHLSREGIIGVTMPGFGTTSRTYNNALKMMRLLGVGIREISIKASVEQHFQDIGQDISLHDVTYENSQARERTQILMDLSNKLSGMVIGTGDLSELALGWATYNGDHMSMYGVNAGVPKTLVKYLVAYCARYEMEDKEISDTLFDVISTPISPELIPAESNGEIKQKTEDLVGPYELHDFFLYHLLRFGFSPSKIFMLARLAFGKDGESVTKYDDATILKWLKTFARRFFQQQFKRSCLPDGPKVGSVSLSPRGDWRMPSDADNTIWLDDCQRLEQSMTAV